MTAEPREPLIVGRWPSQVGRDTVALYCDECGEIYCEHRGTQPVLSALACGDEHPITGHLCKVVGPHDLHDYDGLPDWAAGTDTETTDGP